MGINAHTELYCIFGNPVKHSLSPLIHNTAFNHLAINAVYMAFTPATIKDGIDAIKSLNIRGASITIPYKIDSMEFLDTIDPLAVEIGAINTIHNKNGTLHGYNTDGSGALQALNDKNINVQDSSILIIGNGGSARSIAFTLLNNGAKVYIGGRNKNRIANLSNDLKARYTNVDYILLSKLDAKFMKEIDIIINTTPVGMHPEIDMIPINESLIMPDHAVFDIIYKPHLTKLLSGAEKKGCPVIHGIDMLINQGVIQFEIWTGIKAPVSEIKSVLSSKIDAM